MTNVIFRLKAKRISRNESKVPVGSSFPLTSVCNIMLSGLGSLGSVILYCHHPSIQRNAAALGHFVTLYITFSIADVIHILQYYFRSLSIPKGSDKLIVSLAYFNQLVFNIQEVNSTETVQVCSMASTSMIAQPHRKVCAA